MFYSYNGSSIVEPTNQHNQLQKRSPNMYGLNRVKGLPIIKLEAPPLVHGIVPKQTCKM